MIRVPQNFQDAYFFNFTYIRMMQIFQKVNLKKVENHCCSVCRVDWGQLKQVSIETSRISPKRLKTAEGVKGEKGAVFMSERVNQCFASS